MINEQIRDREVRLVGENGEQLGIMPLEQAQGLADERELDLVKIVPGAKPPVCKLMDYGKFRFEQTKRDKEQRKHQKTVSLKEIRLSPTIEKHDINVRVKNTLKFLSEGDKVKVSIRFRGRQMAHISVGREVMNHFLQELGDACEVERSPIMEGRTMVMTLSPKAAK